MIKYLFISAAFVFASAPSALAQSHPVDAKAKALLEHIVSGISHLSADDGLACEGAGEIIETRVVFRCVEGSGRPFQLTFWRQIYDGFSATVALSDDFVPSDAERVLSYLALKGDGIRSYYNAYSPYTGTLPETVRPEYSASDPVRADPSYTVMYMATPGNYGALLSVAVGPGGLRIYVGVLG